MNLESLKTYVWLNLQRVGLILSDADRAAAGNAADQFSVIKQADQIAGPFLREVKNSKLERFCYSNMGLTYWSLVCISLLALLVSDYRETGEILIRFDYTWLLFILPAILLGIRLFMFSLINIAHLALLVVCAVLNILKIRIFGSEANWIWVFIVVGTLITLGGRIWEGTHRMLENKRWYQGNVRLMKSAESAIPKLSEIYRTIGSDADAQMRQYFSGIAIPSRTPWFSFFRKPDKCNEIALPELSDGLTDFCSPNADRDEPFRNGAEVGVRRTRIHNEHMGWETIPPHMLTHKIQSGQLHPFFGMDVPVHLPELQYSMYVHSWSESITEEGNIHRTDYNKVYTGNRRKANEEYDRLESKYLGTSAEIFAAKYDSQLADSYLMKKKEKLNSLSDYTLESSEYSIPFRREFEESHAECGAVMVYAPDGTVVGLYCSDNKGSIAFAEQIAASQWGIKLTPWANPSSNGQAAYLYHFTI